MIGRPETHPVKKVIGFTDEMIANVELWRAKQKPVPNVSEAIRRLVELALKANMQSLQDLNEAKSHADKAKKLAAELGLKVKVKP